VQEGRSKQDRQFGREELEGLMDEVFGGEVHAQRLASLTDGVDGVLHAASLGVRAIGQGLAVAQGLAPRHAITPVDRLLSNPKLSMEQVFGCWVPFVVGERREVVVNVDGTECEAADQCTVVLGMQTEHGRSTPLVWKTVTRSELKDQRNDHEDDLLVVFAAVVPQNVRVTVVADRGFSDSKLYRFLTEDLGVDSIIRFRGVVYVEDAAGERRKAKDWLGTAGRMRVFRHAWVTAPRHLVPVVVCVQDKAMKEPWCLVSSRQDLTGVEIKVVYGRRFTVEETFRDVKNPRFGLGLKQTVIARNDRRDALFLLAVLAHTLLTLLGKAGQELGMDRMLGATRPGLLSLFRQGLMLFALIPKMREDRLRALAKKFGELLQDHALFTDILGVI
jgi:Transposase DDE domain